MPRRKLYVPGQTVPKTARYAQFDRNGQNVGATEPDLVAGNPFQATMAKGIRWGQVGKATSTPEPKKPKRVKCPKCHHDFDPRHRPSAG